MKISSIELQNVRGFQKLEETKFSDRINIFIGANNSGKSTILNSIFLLQRQNSLTKEDITIGKTQGLITLKFNGSFGQLNANINKLTFNLANSNSRTLHGNNNATKIFHLFEEMEPNNLIYPYLSKRKAVNFQDQINQYNTNAVLGNLTNLYPKIDRLINPDYQPAHSEYVNACNSILGFTISTLASLNGKKGVYFIHNQEHIPLTSMGEGVTSILGLITDLCIAENKIFLIEEPENDIHPTALKELLKFIISKSDTNQFFISTHSNIVMKYLGSEIDTKVFSVTSELSDLNRKKLFVSSLNEVERNEVERRKVLESLGYEFNDFGLWTVWLFLEEATAEIIIRDYLIKWFTPKLTGKIRTYSCQCISQLITKFEDFNRLFVFLHLEPQYKNKAWVIIDKGEEEKAIIDKFKAKYKASGWDENNFSQFSEHDFEIYYPSEFKDKVEKILNEKDKKVKRELKITLIEDLKKWIDSDEKVAKEKFKISADNVIKKLKEIESKI